MAEQASRTTRPFVIHNEDEHRVYWERQKAIGAPEGGPFIDACLSKRYRRSSPYWSPSASTCPICKSKQWHILINRDAGTCNKCGRTITGPALVYAKRKGRGFNSSIPRVRHG